MVRLLLAKGADENIRDEYGYNASYWAHKEKRADFCEILPTPAKRTQQELYDYIH